MPTPEGLRQLLNQEELEAVEAFLATRKTLTPEVLESLYEFFRLGSKIFSPIEIWAPDKNVAVWAKKWGYEEYVDPAGIPYLSDRNLKTSSKE